MQAIHDDPREPDEGLRCLGFSTGAHAVLALLLLGMPPEPASIALDDVTTPLIARLAHVESPAIAPSSTEPATRAGGGGLGGTLHGDDPGPAPRAIPRASSPARAHGTTDARATLSALAHQLGQLSSSPSAFTGPIGDTSTLVADLDGTGLDMRGTGRGAGGHGGDTVDAVGFGAPGYGVTCSGPIFEERVARVGRAAAIEVCNAARNGIGIGMAGFGTRTSTAAVPDDLGERTGVPRLRCGGAPTGCTAIVNGALSRDAVQRVVRRHTAEIRACYEAALATRPDLEGRVTAGWTITPEGRVLASHVDAARTDLRHAPTEACIAAATARWSFPAAPGITVVSYPFMLSPTAE